MVERDYILNSGVGIHTTKKTSNCSYHLKSDYFQGIYKFPLKKCFSVHNIEFIDYFQELSLVSGDDLCLGANTVSVSVC